MWRTDPLAAIIPNGIKLKVLPPPSHDDYWHWNGRLIVYEAPEPHARYVIGVDTGKGLGQDRSVVEVIRVGDHLRADEQVAEFACDFLQPLDFAEVAAAIGRLYGGIEGEALAVVECNSAGGGDEVLFDMRSRWGYSNIFLWKVYDKAKVVISTKLGWWTTPHNRRRLCVRGIHAFQGGDVIINSTHLLNEMADFKADLHDATKLAAESGKHDDRVLALFMALWGAHDDERIGGEDVSRDRRVLTRAGKVRQTEAALGSPKRDFQSSDMSLEQVNAAIEELLNDE